MRTIIVRKLGFRNWMCAIVGPAPVLMTDIKRPSLALQIGRDIVKNRLYVSQ